MSVSFILGIVCLVISNIILLTIDKRESASSNIQSAAVSLFILIVGMNAFSHQRDIVLKQQNAEIIQLLKADAPSTVEASNGR